jgi:hypothetical protein
VKGSGLSISSEKPIGEDGLRTHGLRVVASRIASILERGRSICSRFLVVRGRSEYDHRGGRGLWDSYWRLRRRDAPIWCGVDLAKAQPIVGFPLRGDVAGPVSEKTIGEDTHCAL